MISYNQMVALCAEIQKVLDEATFVEMRELAEGKWLLLFKNGEERHALLICVRYPFERFHLAPLQKGKDTAFTHKIEQNLKGVNVTKVELLQEDRIFVLRLARGERALLLLLELIPRHANLYLLDEKWKILAAYRPTNFYRIQTPSARFRT